MDTDLNNEILKNTTPKFVVIESLYIVLIGCDTYDLLNGINNSNYLSPECLRIKKYFIAIKGVMFILCILHYAQIKWKYRPRLILRSTS